jgi:outer membrane protein assembly factor BamD (BamD/ComL family)
MDKIEAQPLCEQAMDKIEAQRLYEQGNAYRKRSQWHEAINCYIRAAELDAESPAVEARKMLEDILAFYHKDAYNP